MVNKKFSNALFSDLLVPALGTTITNKTHQDLGFQLAEREREKERFYISKNSKWNIQHLYVIALILI